MERPKDDEIEVIVIGPGFGECIIVHYGENRWFIVDSCIERGRDTSAAISYLESINVSPAKSVTMILVTHYHSDHIGGLQSLVAACPQAEFAFSPGAEPEKFVNFIGGFQKSPAINNGTSELYDSFALVKKRNQKFRLCGANKLLLRHVSPATGIKTKITSLSPSDKDCFEFLNYISQRMPERGPQIGRLPAPDGNLLSCATWVEIGQRNILLGADLEERGRPDTGWTAVINSSLRPEGVADVIKIPHHGSKNGHHEDVWSQMLRAVDVVAVVTPWYRNHGLPTKQDCRRISDRAAKSYLTSIRSGLSLRHGQAVDRTLREAGIELTRSDSPLGWVRLRAPINSPATPWAIERSTNSSLLSALA